MYNKEELEQLVKKCFSYAALAKELNIPLTGHYNEKIKKIVEEYDLDISHFTGQGWNKNNFDYSRFKYGNSIKVANALPALVNLKGHQCEKCHNSLWLEQKIPLEIHHKDGDHLNNELENLELLCPNCHALTENWRGKNISKKNKDAIPEEEFVNSLRTHTSVRQALIAIGLTGAGGNYDRAYDLINKYNIEHLKKK